jgi:hypothetical protein
VQSCGGGHIQDTTNIVDSKMNVVFSNNIGSFFKFQLTVGVEESIVNVLNRLRMTDQLFKSYVCAFTIDS